MLTFPFARQIVVICYIVLVLLDWFYVMAIKSQMEAVATAWFVIVPLLGYFYFAFAIFSLFFMYARQRLGIALGCFVLLFGAILDVITFNFIYSHLDGVLFELIIISLIVLNCGVATLLVADQDEYKED